MNFLKLALLGFFAVATPMMLAACDQNDNNSVEEVTEEIGDEIDDATTN